MCVFFEFGILIKVFWIIGEFLSCFRYLGSRCIDFLVNKEFMVGI